jgi:hypothetical protein
MLSNQPPLKRFLLFGNNFDDYCAASSQVIGSFDVLFDALRTVEMRIYDYYEILDLVEKKWVLRANDD